MARKTVEQDQLPGLFDPSLPLPAIKDVLTPHEIIRSGLSSRRGSKRQTYRNSSAQKPEKTEKPIKRVPASTQIRIIRDTQGFTPYSYHEASLGTALVNDIGKPYSTTKSLSEIQARYRKSNAARRDPNGAVSSVIRNMAGFATDARITGLLVGRLTGYLQDVNPKLVLEALTYETDPEFFLPLLRSARINESLQAASDEEVPYRNIGDTFDFDYMSGAYEGSLEAANVSFLGLCTVADARDLARQVSEEQVLREDFWHTRLAEADAFPPASDALAMVRGVPARIY